MLWNGLLLFGKNRAPNALLSQQFSQDKRSLADYPIAFRTLAKESEWNEHALVTAFHHGLSDSLKDGLAYLGCPTDLEPLIAHAIRSDTRMRERRRDLGSFQKPPEGGPWSFPARDDPEPMQIEQRDYRLERESGDCVRGTAGTAAS